MGVRHKLISWFSAVIILLAIVVYIAGIATPWWLRGQRLDVWAGLWKNCIGNKCTSIADGSNGDWLRACQALSISALLSGLLSLGLEVIMLRASKESSVTTLKYGLIATILFTGISIFILLLIYYLKNDVMYPGHLYSLSLSFTLTLVAGSVFLCVALILSVEIFGAKQLRASSPSSSP